MVPEVSCLEPPPVPEFGKRDESGNLIYQHYSSNWFNLSFMDGDQGYKITRKERKKLYQPWMEFKPEEVTEKDLEFISENKNDHFNEVYEIVKNGSTANYTCPRGWVFQDSNNVSHIAVCRNWTWRVEFNSSKPCVRKSEFILYICVIFFCF